MDNDLTLKDAALKLGFVSEEEFDRVVDPAKMVAPYVAAADGKQKRMPGVQMTLEERADLVLSFARVLYVNGQSTDQTLTSTERLGHTLGFHAKIIPRCGELLLAREGDTGLISGIEADPT